MESKVGFEVLLNTPGKINSMDGEKWWPGFELVVTAGPDKG
jgi:hypothetical protein